jgi:hypothetical protein
MADLWSNTPINSPSRSWKTTHRELQVAIDFDLQHWKKITKQIIICINIDPDILRWGQTPHGIFTLKEGYTLQEKFQNIKKYSIWETIWKS